VLCGLPVRKLREGELLYERRNGQFVLQVTGHPDFGVPFGQDRIVPIFLATLAVRQKSQVIRFKTASEMLETFGMHKGGKEYRRLVAAFERIFGATMFFGTNSVSARAKVVQRSRFNFLREAQIWYNKEPNQRVLSDEFENVIVLSDESIGRS
jgi:plasmid replication initiation protein